MEYPGELAGWMVDEVIEALGIDNGIEVELLTVAPTAYSDDAGVQLETVWNQLKPETQKTLTDRAIEEMNARDDEDLDLP